MKLLSWGTSAYSMDSVIDIMNSEMATCVKIVNNLLHYLPR